MFGDSLFVLIIKANKLLEKRCAEMQTSDDLTAALFLESDIAEACASASSNGMGVNRYASLIGYHRCRLNQWLSEGEE